MDDEQGAVLAPHDHHAFGLELLEGAHSDKPIRGCAGGSAHEAVPSLKLTAASPPPPATSISSPERPQRRRRSRGCGPPYIWVIERDALGDDPIAAELSKQAVEHCLAVHACMEPSLADSRRIAHDVPIAAKDVVAEGPRGDVRVGDSLKPVLFRNRIPYRRLVGHEFSQSDRLRRSPFNFEEPGEPGPQILPAEKVPVGDVEGTVRCR